jgi:hypothetical protein
MCSEQRADPGVLIQQASDSQRHRFGLAAASQLIGRLLYQRRLIVTTFGISFSFAIMQLHIK